LAEKSRKERVKGKVDTHVYLSTEVYQRLWDYVKRNFPSPKGAFNKVVEDAVKEFLDRHGG